MLISSQTLRFETISFLKSNKQQDRIDFSIQLNLYGKVCMKKSMKTRVLQRTEVVTTGASTWEL